MKTRQILSLHRTSVLIVLSAFFLTGITGCDPDQKHVEETTAETKATTLQLNNGVKWAANAETTQGINNMIGAISKFQEGENAADYKLLQGTLDKEFQQILERCTMKGEAHDQLHLYLMPLKDMFAQLDSSDPAVISTTMTDIDDHLQLYFEYFE